MNNRSEAGIALFMALFMLTWLSLLSVALAQAIILNLQINRYAQMATSYHQTAESILSEGIRQISKLSQFTQPNTHTVFTQAQGLRIFNSSTTDQVHELGVDEWDQSASSSGGYLIEYLASVPLTPTALVNHGLQANTVMNYLFRVTAYVAGPTSQPVAALQSNYQKVFFTTGAATSIPGFVYRYRNLPIESL